MNATQNFIHFVILNGDEEIRVKTHLQEYPDLRLLIKQYLKRDDFGQCGGMGRCATCMVTIAPNIYPQEKTPNVFSRYMRRSIELSCQVIINDDLANKKVSVLAQSLL